MLSQAYKSKMGMEVYCAPSDGGQSVAESHYYPLAIEQTEEYLVMWQYSLEAHFSVI